MNPNWQFVWFLCRFQAYLERFWFYFCNLVLSNINYLHLNRFLCSSLSRFVWNWLVAELLCYWVSLFFYSIDVFYLKVTLMILILMLNDMQFLWETFNVQTQPHKLCDSEWKLILIYSVPCNHWRKNKYYIYIILFI